MLPILERAAIDQFSNIEAAHVYKFGWECRRNFVRVSQDRNMHLPLVCFGGDRHSIWPCCRCSWDCSEGKAVTRKEWTHNGTRGFCTWWLSMSFKLTLHKSVFTRMQCYRLLCRSTKTSRDGIIKPHRATGGPSPRGCRTFETGPPHQMSCSLFRNRKLWVFIDESKSPEQVILVQPGLFGSNGLSWSVWAIK